MLLRVPAGRVALLTAVVLSLLSGCGFQLRGTGTGGELASLERYAWTIREASPAVEAVAATLKRFDMLEAAAAPDREVIVELRRVIESRRTISVTQLAREAEYEVLATLVYRVVNRDGTEIRGESRLSEARAYLIDRDNIMGSAREEEILRGEMNEQLAFALVRELGNL